MPSNSRASAMTFRFEPLREKSVFFNNQRKPVTRSDRENGEYPYYGAAGIQDYVSEFIFDGRYILVGEDGTVISNDEHPVVQIAEGKFWVNNHAHVIRPTSDEGFDFLYYALVGSKVKNLVTGAVQPKLSMTNLKSLLIPWPESAEVRRGIGGTLSILDKKIQANNALAETLEAIAQSLFKSWFIDFDPVKAKMSGEKPFGMDEETAALFPDSMDESELGPIPTGWDICSVDGFGRVVTGKTPSTKEPEYWGTEIPFVTIPDMHGQLVVTSSRRALTQVGADSQQSQSLPRGTTMVSCIATPGLVSYASLPCQTNQQINSVIPSNQHAPAWLFWHMRSLIPKLIRDSGIGTVFANMNKSDFSNIKSIAPPKSLRDSFSQVATPILEMVENLSRESQNLAEVRDALLPRLISGQLEIPDEILVS